MIRKETLVDFDEIFVFAEKEHNIDWNKCCDIFHRGSILCNEEGRNKSFDLAELEDTVERNKENPHKYYDKNRQIGYPIIIDFMKKNNLTEMRVIND